MVAFLSRIKIIVVLPPPEPTIEYINVKTISVGLGMGDLDKSIGRYLVGSDVG